MSKFPVKVQTHPLEKLSTLNCLPIQLFYQQDSLSFPISYVVEKVCDFYLYYKTSINQRVFFFLSFPETIQL